MDRMGSVVALYELWARARRQRQWAASFGLHLALMDRLVVDHGPGLECNPGIMRAALHRLDAEMEVIRVGGLSFPVRAFEVRMSFLACAAMGWDRVASSLATVQNLLIAEEFADQFGGPLHVPEDQKWAGC